MPDELDAEAKSLAYQAAGLSVELEEGPPAFEAEPITNGISPLVHQRWTIANLLDTVFPPLVWLVNEMIPEGLTVISGRPKVGKSWMALQIAHAVGTGGMFLGKKAAHGKVLFIAFEDNARRLQDRIIKQQIPRTATIDFYTDWDLLHKGGLNKLVVAQEAEGYKLIIIDTLSRALSGLNQKEAHIIGPTIDQLQKFAIGRAIGALFTDHNRKPGEHNRDPIDDLIDSTAKSKPLDAIWGIYKTRGKIGASLEGSGREFPETSLAIKFDAELWCWQPGDLNDRQAEIYEALTALGKSQITPIANFIGQDKGNTYRLIIPMVENGSVLRKEEGRYVFYENNK